MLTYTYIELFITPPSVLVNTKNPEGCFKIQSQYDTDIYASQYNLILIIPDPLEGNSVALQNQHIVIHVEDYHGLAFKQQPEGNVTVGEGDNAYFPCTYDGISTKPYWNITSANGQELIVSTSRLPYKYYFNGSGLLVRNVDSSVNMTSYSCILQVFDRNKLTFQHSTSGQLIVSENIHFWLQFAINGIYMISHSRHINISDGDSLKVTVEKSGYSHSTYLVSVSTTFKGSCGGKEKF